MKTFMPILENLNDKQYYFDRLKNKYKIILSNFDNVYIFGAAKLGKQVYEFCSQKNINVLGFIDNDSSKFGKKYQEKTIYKLNDIDPKATIILAVSSCLIDITEQLKKNGYTEFIPFNVIAALDDLDFNLSSYNGLIDDIFDNKTNILEFYYRLEDDYSKELLSNLLNFRLMPDKVLDKKWVSPLEKHYFEDSIIDFSKIDYFLDGGSYDGDTTLKFIEYNSSYKGIYCFEPEKGLLNLTKKRTVEYKNIKYFENALYDKSVVLNFDETGTGSGNINLKGTTKVDAVLIDNTLNKVDYIKFDIEGAEIQALNGAKNIIKSQKPKLAISLYHNPQDLWKIYKSISQIREDYIFYVRHYSQSLLDSVLYAV